MLLQSPYLAAAALVLSAFVAGANETADARSGEQVFNQACFSCHGTGFYDAPVIGDRYAWEARVDKGEPALLENTLRGFNSMPPRGACSDCTDAEIEAAMKYLLLQQ